MNILAMSEDAKHDHPLSSVLLLKTKQSTGTNYTVGCIPKIYKGQLIFYWIQAKKKKKNNFLWLFHG